MAASHRGIDLAPNTPESFNYETKYIVLNFMSMIPERYSSHPHTPLTSTSESDLFIKQISRSLPASPPKHRHRKSSSKRNSNGLQPQASEDNVGYRYQAAKKNLKQVSNGSDDNELLGESLNKSSNTYEQSEYDTMSRHHAHGRGSLNLSQYRHLTMTNRTDSEISTYSNYTDYTSDADDEFEETSNASSALGSLNWTGNKNRDSFKGDNVDIRHLLSSLPTVPSESEIENESLPSQRWLEGTDDVDGKFSVNGSPSPVDVQHVKLDIVGSEEMLGEVDLDVVESGSISIDIPHSSTTTPSIDRTELRLHIQDQTEWHCEEQRKLQLLFAEMRAELQDEMTSFESEVEDAIKKHIINPVESPFSVPVSPQTAAARVLARIGDEVKDHYEQRFQEALRSLFPDQQPAYFNYDSFRRIANDVIDENLPGWRQVALILMYGQNVAWRAVENGVRGVGNFVDYTARLIEDSAAEFIIQQGGWRAVMNFDPSQSSESPLSPDSLGDVLSIDEDQLKFDNVEISEERSDYSHSNNNTYQQKRFEICPYTADPEPEIEFEDISDVVVVPNLTVPVHNKKFDTRDYIHILIFLIQFVAFAIRKSSK